MLSFASATGNIFNRLGVCGNVLSWLDAYQVQQLSNLTNTTTGVVAQLNSESDIQGIVGTGYPGVLNSAGIAAGNNMAATAQAVVNRIVFRDNPRQNQDLTTLNILASVQEIIRQMNVAGASVLQTTVGASATLTNLLNNGNFIGVGNGVIVTSVYRPSDGAMMENSYAEQIQLVCNDDSYIGGAAAGNEGFIITGQGASISPYAFDWPLGSNCNASLNVIAASADNSLNNILTNSGFDAWTSNVPDNWTLVVGTAGTNIFQENSITYDGVSAVRITGDASGTLTQIKQQFDDEDGTEGTLSPYVQYSFNIFLRRDGVAAATGQLTIDLVDQNDVVINDVKGTLNTTTIDLTLLNTVYTPYNVAFRTGPSLPTQQYLRIRLTTAYEDGRSFYLDYSGMGQMTQCYASGPFASIHAGSIPFIQGDYGYATVTNARGSGGTLDTFQTLMARLMAGSSGDMIANGLLLPSALVPSVPDQLI